MPRGKFISTNQKHYPDLSSASDWLCRVGNLFQPIRSTTQIWLVTRHQYGISALVSQTSFGGETSGSVAEYKKVIVKVTANHSCRNVNLNLILVAATTLGFIFHITDSLMRNFGGYA